jgi:hypothetical protein
MKWIHLFSERWLRSDSSRGEKWEISGSRFLNKPFTGGHDEKKVSGGCVFDRRGFVVIWPGVSSTL